MTAQTLTCTFENFYLGFKRLVPDFNPGELCAALGSVGEDVAQELPVDAGHGGRLPVHVQASAQLGDLARDEAGGSAGS